MPSLEELAEFWRAEGIKNIIPSVGTEFAEGIDIRESLRGIIDSSGGVIEIGCGYGRLCRAFPADKYIGYDVNPEALELARQKNPNYRFELIEPAAPLSKAGTALIYAVALHISDEELLRFLTPVCEAAPVIVLVELMDVRWRRMGNPPVFNRDPEHYILTMARLGFRLKSYGKAVYARYNTPEWNVGRDIRYTIHIYERFQSS
jgi:SAM-dependent methyltransferase